MAGQNSESDTLSKGGTIMKRELKDYLGKDLMKEVGFDRVPSYIIEKSVPELLNLKGKKAIVTGAGGPGLGQACANRLAGSGADVALVDINLDGAKQVAEQIEKRWGTKAIAVQGSIIDWDEVKRFMAESNEKLGGIDIVVNNAIAGIHSGDFATATKKDIDITVLGVLTQVMYISRIALDYMIPQKSGRIINVASEGGRSVHRNILLYNACKSGVIGFTRNLAYEVAEHGIYVLGVAPGIMLHKGLQWSLNNLNEDTWPGVEAILDGLDKVVVGGRVSLPEEVANMVAFLASDAASYMAGVTISMGGGQTMVE